MWSRAGISIMTFGAVWRRGARAKMRNKELAIHVHVRIVGSGECARKIRSTYNVTVCTFRARHSRKVVRLTRLEPAQT